jgi:sec-independent protein translocase protein TatA
VLYALGNVPLGIGAWEIVLLLLVALLVFGPKRLPEMGRSLGRGLREFKSAITGLKVDVEPEDVAPALPAAKAAAREQDPV